MSGCWPGSKSLNIMLHQSFDTVFAPMLPLFFTLHTAIVYADRWAENVRPWTNRDKSETVYLTYILSYTMLRCHLLSFAFYEQLINRELTTRCIQFLWERLSMFEIISKLLSFQIANFYGNKVSIFKYKYILEN